MSNDVSRFARATFRYETLPEEVTISNRVRDFARGAFEFKTPNEYATTRVEFQIADESGQVGLYLKVQVFDRYLHVGRQITFSEIEYARAWADEEIDRWGANEMKELWNEVWNSELKRARTGKLSAEVKEKLVR